MILFSSHWCCPASLSLELAVQSPLCLASGEYKINWIVTSAEHATIPSLPKRNWCETELSTELKGLGYFKCFSPWFNWSPVNSAGTETLGLFFCQSLHTNDGCIRLTAINNMVSVLTTNALTLPYLALSRSIGFHLLITTNEWEGTIPDFHAVSIRHRLAHVTLFNLSNHRCWCCFVLKAHSCLCEFL